MSRQGRWAGYAWAIAAIALCTATGLAMQARFDPVNIAMVYLLAVVVIALRFTQGAAVATALLSVAAFDFLFVPPHGTLSVADAQYLLTFAIMLTVALVISRLTRTAQRQAEAQAALSVVAETERIRNALLASISHDLRTPLAVMTGASSSLAEGGERMSAEERRALAHSVYEQCREMSEHVAKVLQMTRLEIGGIALERDWTALGEVAGAALARLRERLARHRVMLEVPGDLPLVHVDAALIEQALGNLLENAARHTPPGTLIRLRVQPRAADLVVSVEDFGPGLAERDMERVFAKFHDDARESPAGGLGLGLAICRAIVRLHGGQAWAEQIPGGGTAFRFTVPVTAAPRMPLEASAA